MKTNTFRDTGILLIRLGFGIMFINYGYPALMGGPAKWADLGESINNFGITFGYSFWGFMSAITNFGGGILLILGLFTRPVAAFMFINMVVAFEVHFAEKHSFMSGSHAFEDAIVFLSLVLIGGGRFSLDTLIGRK